MSAKHIHTAASRETARYGDEKKTPEGMESWDRGGGGHVALFLMTPQCDGNAVNEEGWDKMRCSHMEARQGMGEEPGEPPAKLDAFRSRTGG